MLQDDKATNIGYKLHLLTIEMEELQSEIQNYKELIAHHAMLKSDFREIKSKGGKRGNMFLMKSYW